MKRSGSINLVSHYFLKEVSDSNDWFTGFLILVSNCESKNFRSKAPSISIKVRYFNKQGDLHCMDIQKVVEFPYKPK